MKKMVLVAAVAALSSGAFAQSYNNIVELVTINKNGKFELSMKATTDSAKADDVGKILNSVKGSINLASSNNKKIDGSYYIDGLGSCEVTTNEDIGEAKMICDLNSKIKKDNK